MVPPSFWQHPSLQKALAARHMGQVIAAYRRHPARAAPLSQEVVAGWIGLTQSQLSRIETGGSVQDLDRLVHWARTLHIPPKRLWFTLPGSPIADGENDAVYRRDILRVAGVAAAIAPLSSAVTVTGSATCAALSRGTAALWQRFAATADKQTLLPPLHDHLLMIAGVLRDAIGETTPMLATFSEALQLTGEVFFDACRYEEAAHAYALATSAAADAADADRQACAMVRHGYVCLYTGRPRDALAVLDAAGRVAAQGDRQLTTRFWVASVAAQAHAAAGDGPSCRRAWECAGEVLRLPVARNTGWLRFDGSRLAEERGAWQTRLGHHAAAAASLTAALNQPLSARRRGAVLADLITVGAGRGDIDQVLAHASAALPLAAGSGAVASRLRSARPALRQLGADRRVAEVDAQIAALST
ncbi:hypothetical protein GCM10010124_08000 [Pilimelia terevasa]|uniref:HTH cro/C1-type domain-containing protein n=1 Tax=Pilimelia terevasa TaxID=53372 RepID=A0A8J3BFC4_9ACTN|nr:helix-turn-helix transcriptional regulator [Pilimelia terevasa]GGK17835.1 hypothetical protein GCM10010124_08000 [Pilimelia terevasa]